MSRSTGDVRIRWSGLRMSWELPNHILAGPSPAPISNRVSATHIIQRAPGAGCARRRPCPRIPPICRRYPETAPVIALPFPHKCLSRAVCGRTGEGLCRWNGHSTPVLFKRYCNRQTHFNQTAKFCGHVQLNFVKVVTWRIIVIKLDANHATTRNTVVWCEFNMLTFPSQVDSDHFAPYWRLS